LRETVMPPAKRATKKVRKAAKPVRKPAKKAMSSAHKAALSQGRDASRHVRAYLDALEANRPKRGRRLDPASVKKRIVLIDEQLKQAGGFERLNLLADRAALEGKLAGADVTVDLGALRKEFVKHAKHYGDRKKISYATWRAAGVSAQDLKDAGIARTRSGS
jgi:hypothetical protein